MSLRNINNQQYDYSKVHQVTPEELQKTQVLNLQEFETREKIRKKFCVKGSNVYIALVKNDSIFITKRIGQ